jgi:hypothetical protein
MKRILIFIATLFTCSCATTEYAGNSSSGYLRFAQYRITPEQAVKLAEPYIDKTYELRLQNRHSIMKGPLQVTVVVRGDWYYVSRDNYPYKTIEAYRYHAVRVHVQTGEVREPE